MQPLTSNLCPPTLVEEVIMQVILLEDIPSLGKVGDMVKVSDGYGRNYLIPRKKAIFATEKNLKALQHEKVLVQQRLSKMKKDATKMVEEIGKLSCTFTKNVGESGKIFGSVTSMDIEAFLKENGFDIDRKKILLDEPIKNLGMHTVTIKLQPETTAHLKVWVVQE
jgi:large subunit ribosomal protein L9